MFATRFAKSFVARSGQLGLRRCWVVPRRPIGAAGLYIGESAGLVRAKSSGLICLTGPATKSGGLILAESNELSESVRRTDLFRTSKRHA